MNILAIDTGFGDCKIVYGTENGIKNIFKFNSVVGSVKKNELVNDKRIYEFNGNSYYVGELALSLESNKIIDMSYYANLEAYTPLFIKYSLDQLNITPDIIIGGLSIAHIINSGHYKNAISTYLTNLGITCSLEILPQGLGGKLTIDKYGMNFPEFNKQFTEGANYLGVDLGFNTIDIFQVINGKTSSNLIKGIEHQGLIKIIARVLDYIKDTYSIHFSLKEGKDIFDNGYFRVRGKIYNLSSVIDKFKSEYLVNLEALIESRFGAILDKVDNMYIFGGGSYSFEDKVSDFIKVPATKSEYYNAIGNYIYGTTIK